MTVSPSCLASRMTALRGFLLVCRIAINGTKDEQRRSERRNLKHQREGYDDYYFNFVMIILRAIATKYIYLKKPVPIHEVGVGGRSHLSLVDSITLFALFAHFLGFFVA